MRFESLRVKGLGPFREEIAIDFNSIEGRLVAITGANGAGKSTLLELLAGSLYRQCPTRGPLSGLATARDAFVEANVVNGQRYRVRQTVDMVSGKGETVIVDGDGRPVVASGKLREADAYVAKHLPPPEVLYASTFAAQGSGGFLELKPGERKSVLLRVLGIERLEALAEKAREHARSAKGAIATLDARISDEKARASDPLIVLDELANLNATKVIHEESLVRARTELDDIVASDERARTAAREAEEARRRRAELEARLQTAITKSGDLSKRLGNNQGLLAQADEIRAAQASDKLLLEESAGLTERIANARTDESLAARERATARDGLNDLNGRIVRARERQTRLSTRIADKKKIEDAATTAAALRNTVGEAEQAMEAIEESIKQKNELTLSDVHGRLDNLRTAVKRIADGGKGPKDIASKAIVADDEAAKQAIEVPEQIAALRKSLNEARTAITTKRRELTTAEQLAARATEISSAEAEIVEAGAEIERLEQEATSMTSSFEFADKQLTEKQTTLQTLTGERDAVEAKRAKLEPLLKLVDRLTQAEARISELSPQVEALKSEVDSLKKQIDDLPVAPTEPIAFPDVAAARRVVENIDGDLRRTEAAIAVKTAQLSDANASKERLQALDGERQRGDTELADWMRLADDLGRDGIQAMEVDNAGPELTTIANELLHTAFGSRFTIRFDTQRASADGKKTIEGLDVSVIDTERGRDANAETLSGGERVIISEAIALALSTLACRRSGVEHPTLVRDESGAALDEGRARAYVAMLRRAADLIGADKVLLVSHTPSVWDLCDARIEVCDGRVRVAI